MVSDGGSPDWGKGSGFKFFFQNYPHELEIEGREKQLGNEGKDAGLPEWIERTARTMRAGRDRSSAAVGSISGLEEMSSNGRSVGIGV